MDTVLHQHLIFTLIAIAIVLASVTVWRSLRKRHVILIIFAWSVGCFAVGMWLVTSLNGRSTGNIPLVFSLVGVIAASVGQLTRHHKEGKEPSSVLPKPEQSGPGSALNNRQPRENRNRRRNQPSSWDWTWPPELWRYLVMGGSSVLIVFTVVTVLAIVLSIRHPWGARPAPSAPVPSQAHEFTGLPTVKESWTYHTGLPSKRGSADSWRTPAVASDGTVYALGEHQVFALSASGELKSRFPASDLPRFGPLSSLLIADDGAVWVGTKFGWLIRITVAGDAQPQFGGPGDINQLALSSTGVLLVCGENMSNTIVTTGYPKGPADVARSIGPNLGKLKSAAFGPHEEITIADDDLTSWPVNFLSSWPADSRQPNWRYKVSAGCHQPAIARDGTIYVACPDEMLAINTDGSRKWSFPTKFPTPPVIAEDGTLFFGGAIDGNVYSLDPDGHLHWTFPVGKPVGSTPAISRSGVIYVGSQNGYLYALDAAGSPLWALKTNGEVGSPTIGPDGTVYVQSGDGTLHAIAQAQNGGLAGQWPKLDANEINTARSQ